jgi:SAM-dependent methyltransferase
LKATRGNGLLEGFLAERRTNLANRLISESSRKGRILDIGCGATPYFLMNTKFLEKHGLDKLHETGVRVSKERNILLRHYDIEKEDRLPYGDNFFDVVTMLAVFEHIEPSRLVTVLREVYRVMKPKGQFIMTVPAAWADILLRTLARFRLVSREEIDEHKAKYTHKKIGGLLTKAGFSAADCRHGYFEAFMNLWVSVSK